MKHFTRHPSKVTAATDILSFKCPGCKNKTLYSAEQDVHRAADVDENELFICDECGGQFRAHPQYDGSIKFTESIESATIVCSNIDMLTKCIVTTKDYPWPDLVELTENEAELFDKLGWCTPVREGLYEITTPKNTRMKYVGSNGYWMYFEVEGTGITVAFYSKRLEADFDEYFAISKSVESATSADGEKNVYSSEQPGIRRKSTHRPVTAAKIRPADYEDDIQEISQEFTSENTSINSSKLPAIFKMVTFQPGTINIDYGGGRFDNVADYLTQFDVINLVYDPYNRTPEHNKDVIRTVRKAGGADTATCSNVLNVIKEPEVRQNVLQNIKKLVKPNGTVYITVYEGSGKGNEGPTKSGYQLNRKTADYLEEIQEVFPDAKRKGKLIVATNKGSANSSVDIKASSDIVWDDLDWNQQIQVMKRYIRNYKGARIFEDFAEYINMPVEDIIDAFSDAESRRDIRIPEKMQLDSEYRNDDIYSSSSVDANTDEYSRVDASSRTVNSSTNIKASSTEGYVYTYCDECGKKNRVKVTFNNFNEPFNDTEYKCKYCGTNNLLTDPHSYDENGNVVEASQSYLDRIEELMNQGLDEETASREAYAEFYPDEYDVDDYDEIYSANYGGAYYVEVNSTQRGTAPYEKKFSDFNSAFSFAKKRGNSKTIIYIWDIPKEERSSNSIPNAVYDFDSGWQIIRPVGANEDRSVNKTIASANYGGAYYVDDEYIDSSTDITSAYKLWMGKYKSAKDNKMHKVYFEFDTSDFEEAEQEFEDIIPEPYSYARLLGTAPHEALLQKDGFEKIQSSSSVSSRYWYFTRHGVQPGSVPKYVNILDIVDKPEGSYFLADGVILTKDLRDYDIKEREPEDSVTSSTRIKSKGNNQYIQASLVETPPEVVDELIAILGSYGFILDPSFKQNPGKTWMGAVHLQVIYVDSHVERYDRQALMQYVTRDMIDEIHQLEETFDCPITWSFGTNKEGQVTGGLDILEKYVPDDIESSTVVSARKYSIKTLHDNLLNRASQLMRNMGYPLSEIADYLVVEVSLAEEGWISCEVRAELDYDGMEQMIEVLNPIVKKYDKEAYFDHVTEGIISAYLSSGKFNAINSATELDEYGKIVGHPPKYKCTRVGSYKGVDILKWIRGGDPKPSDNTANYFVAYKNGSIFGPAFYTLQEAKDAIDGYERDKRYAFRDASRVSSSTIKSALANSDTNSSRVFELVQYIPDSGENGPEGDKFYVVDWGEFESEESAEAYWSAKIQDRSYFVREGDPNDYIEEGTILGGWGVDDYPEPPDQTEPREEDTTETIEIDLDDDVTCKDGFIEFVGDPKFVKYEDDWTPEDESSYQLDDAEGVIEKVLDLLVVQIPEEDGTYHVKGTVKLVYDVKLVYYDEYYRPGDEEHFLSEDQCECDYDYKSSEMEDIEVTSK